MGYAAKDPTTRAEPFNNLTQYRGDNNNSGICAEKVIPKNKFAWRFVTDAAVESSAAVVNYKAYFGSKDTYVYCLDADNGEKIWSYKTGNTVSATPYVAGGKVYIGSGDRNMYCLDANTGNKTWNFTTKGAISSSVKEYNGHLYFGCDDGNVYCLDKTGKKAWNFSITPKRSYVWSTPALNDGLLYIGADIGSQKGRLVCLDAKSGEFMYDIYSGDIYSSVCISGDNMLFTDGLGNKILNHNRKTGQKIWEFSTPPGEDGNTYTSPTVHGGKVFFSDYKWTYCLQLNDSNGDKILSQSDVIWKTPLENWQGGSSPLVVSGRVLIGSSTALHCLYEENGTQEWAYSVDTVIVSSPVIVNGMLYFGCGNGSMYCLECQQEGVVPPDVNITPEEEVLDLYPTITIPFAIFVVVDIALLVLIIVVKVKRKGVDKGAG